MQFKEPQHSMEFARLSPLMKVLAMDFDRMSRSMGIDPIVTRILDRVDGESGVHIVGRAIDWRDEHDGASLYTEKQRDELLSYFKNTWIRNDGLETLIHHSFNGGPWHFHIQLPASTLVLSPMLQFFG